MIGYIHGTVDTLVGTELLILPHGSGVGYLVSVTGEHLTMETGSEVRLYIYHHITEQSQKLFGFGSMGQRDLFMTLISVNGLGPKGAMSLLEVGEKQLLEGIANGDEKVLTQASGVGPKLAKKVILELAGKIDLTGISPSTSSAPVVGDDEQILSTLVSMGYDRKAVVQVLGTIPDGMKSIEDKTRYCIKQLAHA